MGLVEHDEDVGDKAFSNGRFLPRYHRPFAYVTKATRSQEHKMRIPFLLLTILYLSLQCNASPVGGSEKVTNLRFYLHNTHRGNDPSSVLVAQNTNATAHARGLVPFSSVYVFDDVLTEGPSSTSKVVGNAQGMYVETGKDGYTILETTDCEMTDGPFKGSSFVIEFMYKAKKWRR
uniref:Uncharacterized protein n=1 Tax=Avena sativa TaxID=4498 RepID=A0ACD6ANN6_AVESA